jgi:uncharacterized membrane protein HdeD (DUF308 family)
MSNKSTWAGVVMIIAGLIFLAESNTGGRSSRLGLIVGALIIVLGVIRFSNGRRETPPA